MITCTSNRVGGWIAIATLAAMLTGAVAVSPPALRAQDEGGALELLREKEAEKEGEAKEAGTTPAPPAEEPAAPAAPAAKPAEGEKAAGEKADEPKK